MKETELRLGNYGADINGRVFQLFVITEREQHWKIPNTDRNNETRLLNNSFEKFVFPIPLTEEWLLRFGCQRADFGWYISAEFTLYNPLTKQNVPSSKYYGLMYKNSFVTYRCIIHVHQLQNLYHALTGNELILKETE